jgi:hypothetical protein
LTKGLKVYKRYGRGRGRREEGGGGRRREDERGERRKEEGGGRREEGGGRGVPSFGDKSLDSSTQFGFEFKINLTKGFKVYKRYLLPIFWM